MPKASVPGGAAASDDASSKLLPSQIGDFRTPEFWRQFFEARGGKAFEWYGAWESFAHNFVALVPDRSARILVLGCGNSRMSEHIYQAGYSAITNVDFDEGVIDEMRRKHSKTCPDMQWLCLDVTDMTSTLADASFDVVLDKGTMDAMFTDEKDASVVASIDKMLKEVKRVLVPTTGLYAIVTLAQEHLLLHWARRMLGGGWHGAHVDTFARPDLKSNRCQYFLTARKGAETEAAAEGKLAKPVVFLHTPHSFEDAPPPLKNVAVGGKASKGGAAGAAGGAGAGSSSEVSSAWSCVHPAGEEVATLEGNDELAAGLKEHASTLQWMFETAKMASTVDPAHYFSVDIWSSAGSFMVTPAGSKPPKGLEGAFPRFSITVLDVSLAPSAAVLLIPQGREHEWMFSSKEGQTQLAQSARQYGRIVFVAMGRGHLFDSSAGMKGVQTELSPIVTRFLPKELRDTNASSSSNSTGGKKKASSSSAAPAVPYLAVAEDIGARTLVAQGTSPLSGAWVVEDVDVDSDSDESYYDSSSSSSSETEGAKAPASKKTATKKRSDDRRALHCRRRLIFLSNRNAVQSEACLRGRPATGSKAIGTEGAGAAKEELVPCADALRLSFEYQQAVVALVRLYCRSSSASASPSTGAAAGTSVAGRPLRVCIIGLGSGAMVAFLAAMPPSLLSSLSGGAFTHIDITAVELDPAVVDVAEQHFGFRCDSREELAGASAASASTATAPAATPAPAAATGAKNTVKVVVGDGLAFLTGLSSSASCGDIDILLVDVDAKDLSTAISFPPPAFLARPAVEAMRSSLVAEGGLLVVNFCCRSPPLKKAVLSSLNKAFKESAAASAPAPVPAKEDKSSSSSLVLEVNLEAAVPDAKNSLVAVAGNGALAARLRDAAAKSKAASSPSLPSSRAARQWGKYEHEWAPLLNAVAL